MYRVEAEIDSVIIARVVTRPLVLRSSRATAKVVPAKMTCSVRSSGTLITSRNSKKARIPVAYWATGWFQTGDSVTRFRKRPQRLLGSAWVSSGEPTAGGLGGEVVLMRWRSWWAGAGRFSRHRPGSHWRPGCPIRSRARTGRWPGRHRPIDPVDDPHHTVAEAGPDHVGHVLAQLPAVVGLVDHIQGFGEVRLTRAIGLHQALHQ